MKKLTALLCILVMGIQGAVFNSPSYAEEMSIDRKAEILNQVYILTGDGSTYNLEGMLKRSEAAAFVVKALGKQNEVLQKKDSYAVTSFKDVPKTEWYAPYVGYMTSQNFISGYPDGSFKPDEYVSEKAFYSMVLKSMGYTSSDFDWGTVNKVAFEAGLTTDIMYVFKETDNTNFRRKDVVNALFSALGSNLKGQNKKFIQLLVDSNMITADKAELFGFVKIDKLPSAISGVKVLSSDKITIGFNEDVMVPSADQIDISLKSDPNRKLKVKSLLWDNGILTIEMEPQSDKQAYLLTLSSVTDALGNKVESVKADFTGFNTPELVSPYFKISKVEPINGTTVNLYFTHPLNEKADTELLYDFYVGENKWIEGGYKTITLKRNPEKKNVLTVSLKEGTFASNMEYTVKVRGDLKSAYGVNLNKGTGESMKFVGVTGSLIPATIASVSSESGKYVTVNYSQMVDRESALKTANYSIREKDTGKNMAVLSVYGSKEAAQMDKTFVIKTDGLSSSKTYEITASYIYDTYKTGQLTNLKSEFVGSTTTASEDLKLEAVFPLNKYVLIAAFNRELKDTSINASVSMEGGPIVVMKQVDPENPKFLKLYLSSATPLASGKTYPIRFFSGLYDFMEKTNTSTLNATVSGTDTARLDVALEGAQFIEEGIVLLKFNQPIHKTLNAGIDKYEFSYYDGSAERLILPSSVEIVGDNLVLLKMPYLMGKGTYQVRAKYIYDLSAQFSSHILTAEVK